MNNDESDYTIGLLLGQMEDDYVASVLPGVEDYVKTHNIKLIIFNARFPSNVDGYDFKHNVINNFISDHTIQGLIIITGEMGDYLSREEISDYCRQFYPLPTVSISYEIEGLISILVDNKSGIFEAVDHLVKIHDKKRIAFLKGPEENPEAEERYTGYRNALAANNLPFTEELILKGSYTRDSGEEAAEELLARNVEFDAVVAADDVMAVGVLAKFKTAGIRIPLDVSIIGFDDSDIVLNTTPTLTSVHQPLKEIGNVAASSLHQLLLGKKVEHKMILPTSLKKRQSCGCSPEKTFQIRDDISSTLPLQNLNSYKTIEENQVSELSKKLEKSLSKNFHKIPESKCRDPQIAAILSKALIADYQEHKGGVILLNALNSICDSFNSTGMSVDSSRLLINEIINTLQEIDFFNHQVLKNLFFQAELFYNQLKIREQSILRIEENEKIWSLYQAVETLSVSFDIEESRTRIESILPVFDINTCLIVLYRNSVNSISIRDWQLPDESNLFMCFHNKKRYKEFEEKDFFPTIQVIPPVPWKSDEVHSLLLMPLFFESEQFGYILFSSGKSPALLYEVLRVQISNVLKGAILLREGEQKEKELRSALSRLEDTNVLLHDLSYKDELTGLLNRRGFIESGSLIMKRSIQSNTPFLLLFADLDGLKVINDAHGHDIGDRAICGIAEVLKHVFRDKDIIARLAGDEFTIIAWDADLSHTSMILKRIKKSVNVFNKQKKEVFKLSVSIGYTIFTKERTVSFDTLLVEADKELYRIKQMKKKDRMK